MKIIKTIPLVARGLSLVESCHAKWQHWIAALWLTASGTGMQTVAPPGTYRRSCAPALEGSWIIIIVVLLGSIIIIRPVVVVVVVVVVGHIGVVNRRKYVKKKICGYIDVRQAWSADIYWNSEPHGELKHCIEDSVIWRQLLFYRTVSALKPL